jgi:hypothetical protein
MGRWERRLYDIEQEKEEWREGKQQRRKYYKKEKEEYEIDQDKKRWRERKQEKMKYEDEKEEYE